MVSSPAFLAVVGTSGENRSMTRFLGREQFQFDLRVGGQLRGFAHETQGDGKSAEFVHQSERLGVLAGPDTAFGDLEDFFLGELAAFGDLGGEIVVDAVEPASNLAHCSGV